MKTTPVHFLAGLGTTTCGQPLGSKRWASNEGEVTCPKCLQAMKRALTNEPKHGN